MPFLSMTGFGRGFAIRGGWRVEVEVACVNRKQLDLAVTLPRSLAALEPEVHERVRRVLSRGRLTISVALSSASGRSRRRLEVDTALAADGLRRLRLLQKRVGVPAPANLAELQAVVPFASVAEEVPRPVESGRLLGQALDRALSSFDRMRRREGRALQRDLLGRLARLRRDLRRVEARAPASLAALRTGLLRRLREAGLPAIASDERIVKEIALFADRCDVSEEITRLHSHLDQFESAADQRDPVGRSLDFLCQEIFREINTLGSKTADHATSARIIGMKAELERIREQAQNVE